MLHHPSAVPLNACTVYCQHSLAIGVPSPSFRSPNIAKIVVQLNAPGSPAQYSHIGRSPSPMPPLPAIRAPPSPQLIAQTRLYGDESFSSFFRRLTFSPDGGLLLTPSGHFEDPSNIGVSAWPDHDAPPSRGRRGNPDSNQRQRHQCSFIPGRILLDHPLRSCLVTSKQVWQSSSHPFYTSYGRLLLALKHQKRRKSLWNVETMKSSRST